MNVLNIMKYIIILLVLCSCSAHKRAIWHLKRANKIDPTILDTAFYKIDSIFALSKDSSYVDSVAGNATNLISNELDSISPVKKEAVKKIIRKAILDMRIGKLLSNSSKTLLLKHGKVEFAFSGDNIKVKATTSHVTVQPPKKEGKWYDNLWWILILIVIILIVLKRLI